MKKLSGLILLCATLAGCAGSPMAISMASPEQLAEQSSAALANAYSFGQSQKVLDELTRRGALNPEELAACRSKSLFIGMSEIAAICAMGVPAPGYGSVSTTMTASGVRKQYAYIEPLRRMYLSFENGKLTSIQN
jgi:hypothetical protein